VSLIDSHIYHRALVFVFQVVAVKREELLLAYVVELHRHPYGLAGPHKHRIFKA
jgi:hypothetical protein